MANCDTSEGQRCTRDSDELGDAVTLESAQNGSMRLVRLVVVSWGREGVNFLTKSVLENEELAEGKRMVGVVGWLQWCEKRAKERKSSGRVISCPDWLVEGWSVAARRQMQVSSDKHAESSAATREREPPAKVIKAGRQC